jgi:hypothetical protein
MSRNRSVQWTNAGLLADLLGDSEERSDVAGHCEMSSTRATSRSRVRGDARAVWPAATALALAASLAAALASPAGTAAAVAPAARARAAGTISVSDSGRLHLTSHHGFTLNEAGSASGTISGPIYIHLNVVSTNHVTAEVNLYPSGSSLTGYASASYRSSGGVASFSGTMSVTRGSGRYAYAHGSRLTFAGTIERVDDAITVHVSGSMTT